MSMPTIRYTTVTEAVGMADAADRAFVAWSKTGPGARRELLLEAAKLVQARSAELVRLMIEETATSSFWAEFNVRGALGLLKECAALTTQITGDTIPSDLPGCLTMTFRTPVGVVLGIAPWNAPLLLGLRAVAMPLACGNSVILKASELCPRTHLAIGELLNDAGFPKDVVSVVVNSPDEGPAVVEALIAHEAVRRVNFTGSTSTGRIIGGLAGRYLKPALLELGGKAPLVLLEDADIEQAAAATLFGAYVNQGQICMSTELVIADVSIGDAFADNLVDRLEKLIARPEFEERIYGAMVHNDAADHVEYLVNDAISKGAILLTPRRRVGSRLMPLILDRVSPGMTIFEEESFGPVVAIVRVNGIEDAIRLANLGPYGLAAAVFGRDMQRTLEVARRLDCGVCHINGPTVKSEPAMPFGGVKGSGYGRFNGHAAINEFTELRSVTLQTGFQPLPF